MLLRVYFRIGLLSLSTICSLALQACSCEYSTMNATKSPDGKYEAVLEVQSCGAITSETYILSLYQLPRRDSHWPWGSSSPRETVLMAAHLYHPKLEWTSNSYLVVSCDGCSDVDISYHRDSWKGITVDVSSMLSARTRTK